MKLRRLILRFLPLISPIRTAAYFLIMFATPTISSNQSSIVAFFDHHSSGPRCLSNKWSLIYFTYRIKRFYMTLSIFSFSTSYSKYSRNGMCGYFMADVPQILYISIIRVLMTDVESTSYGTAVGIFSVIRKYFCKWLSTIIIL